MANSHALLAEYSADFARATDVYNRSTALNNRAFVHYDMGNAEASLADFTQALQLQPDAVTHFNRGTVLMKLQRYQDALHDFTAAVQYNPLYAKSYASRGLAYSKLGEVDASIRDYSKAIELDRAAKK